MHVVYMKNPDNIYCYRDSNREYFCGFRYLLAVLFCNSSNVLPFIAIE